MSQSDTFPNLNIKIFKTVNTDNLSYKFNIYIML